MPKWINPLSMRWPEQSLLANYIKQNPQQVFIPRSEDPNKPYSILTNKGDKAFYLTENILRRERKYGKLGYRYEIVGDEILGAENSGVIHPSLATLILGKQYLHTTNKPKKRVIKIQNVNEEQGESTLISQWVPHLSGKVSTVYENQSYTVMRRISGKNLREIFDKEKLSTEKKLQLLLALFKAWQNQVLDNGLVHRDIKPENIMVNFISGNPIPEINIIDFGFAKKIDDESDELAGTPFFIPPEILEWASNPGVYDTYPCLPVMDIYALSRVASVLFSENYFLGAQQEHDLRHLTAKLLDGGLLEEEIKHLVDLGSHASALEKASDLSVDHKVRLKNLIQKMGCYYPNQRISIALAIEKLSSICQERLPAKLNYLKQHYPVYQILSSYPQLFAINKVCIEADEKKINRFLQAILIGKADVELIEKEVDQITKAWHAIKKSNSSPVFNDVFNVLARCLVVSSEEDKATQNEFSVKAKRKIVNYIKTHMNDLISRQDRYALKRLKAMNSLLDELEMNPILRKASDATLEKNVTKILSYQFDRSLSRCHNSSIANVGYAPVHFFVKPNNSRINDVKSNDSGIESNASSNSLNCGAEFLGYTARS